MDWAAVFGFHVGYPTFKTPLTYTPARVVYIFPTPCMNGFKHRGTAFSAHKGLAFFVDAVIFHPMSKLNQDFTGQRSAAQRSAAIRYPRLIRKSPEIPIDRNRTLRDRDRTPSHSFPTARVKYSRFVELCMGIIRLRIQNPSTLGTRFRTRVASWNVCIASISDLKKHISDLRKHPKNTLGFA